MTKKNRWWLIAVYCLVALLVVLTIVACFVPVSKRPEIEDPHAYEIRLDNQAFYQLCDVENNKEKYDRVNAAFNAAFNESFLTSLFSGRLGYTNRIDSTSPSSTFSGYRLNLMYATEQPIMQNGKIYTQSAYSEDPIYYDEITLEITQDAGMTTHYLFYICEYEHNGVIRTRYYRQSFIANFDELYELLSE